MKIFGIVLAALLAIATGLYVTFFFNPQTREQEEINAVWAQFGASVASLGDVVQGAPFNQDEQTAAEGYRHVARFLATFLAYHMDLADPDYPQFMRFPNAVARVGWDNPDNPYLSFPVRGDHAYRLRGNINSFDLVTINVYSGLLGHTPISDIRHVSGMVSDDLIADENGDFVLTLSVEPVDGNWLAQDEALLIEAPVARCRYTNIQLANPWMESLDYANHQSSLNHATTHVDADGRVRYVISRRDPGIRNWLDTAGLLEGSFLARWTYCDEYPSDLLSRVIRLSDLDDHVPADTPRVSPEERAQIIAARQAAISRRYAGGS